jgi:hypothetical protein
MYKKRELNVNKRKPQDMKKALQPDPMTNLHQRLSTQSIVNLKSERSNFFMDDP